MYSGCEMRMMRNENYVAGATSNCICWFGYNLFSELAKGAGYT